MKRILLIAWAILSLGSVVKAQDGNNTSYFLSNLPQQFRLNPAYQPEYKVFIGLPGLSGVSVNDLRLPSRTCCSNGTIRFIWM